MSTRSTTFLSLGLMLLFLALGQGAGQGRKGGRGKPQKPPKAAAEAELAPPAAEALCEPVLVHDDTFGRAERTLHLLRGVPQAGFAAVWRDARDGIGGLYFTRLDPRGRLRGTERPLAARGTGRLETGPALDLDARGQLALAWHSDAPDAEPGFQVRIVRHDGTFHGPETFVPVPAGRRKEARKARATGVEALEDLAPPAPLEPAVVVGREGDAFVAFTFAGRVFVQRVDADGAVRELQLIDQGDPPAAGAPFLLASGTGPELCVWNTDEGVRLRRLDRQRAQPVRIGGPGRVLEVLPIRVDARTEGWWLLVEWNETVALRRLNEAGERAGLDQRLFDSLPGAVEAAIWSRGLAVLAQEDAEGGPFTVQLLTADGAAALGEPLTVLAEGAGPASNPRLAGADDYLLVAWTERRPAGSEVYFRLLTAREMQWGPEQRLSTDEASADQRSPAVAARGGDRAVVAWRDHRDGHATARVRVYASSGEPRTGELSVPAPFEGEAPAPGEALDPRVALAPDGSFAVLWGRPEAALAVQVFDPGGRPLGPMAGVNRSARLGDGFRLVRQEKYRAWLAAWCAAEDGVFVRRIRGNGVPLGEPVRVTDVATATDPTLIELEDGRVVVLYEIGPLLGPRRLAGRFLTAELGSAGRAFELPAPRGVSFRTPQVALGAPRHPGSFFLTWVAGDEQTSNVVAQFFDPAGAAVTEALILTEGPGAQRAPSALRLPDRTWVVAWEDDLAGRRHVYARRLRTGSELGPVRLLSRVTHGHRATGHEPALAAVDTGLFVAFSDAQRSQGSDVWVRVVGAGFDQYAPGGR
jgi:hypothetical protein